jgi:glycosyltransferase involved in cell wall biosynthesis
MESKTKPVILVFVDWFFPGYLAGGPIQSIVSIVNYLNEDFDFRIFTTNRDLNAETPYPGIEYNKWIESDLNCKVYYADPSRLSRTLIQKVIDESHCKLVYINGLFSKYFSVIPLLVLRKHFPSVQVVVAPRGMLGAGALSIKKFKKKGFLTYAKLRGLYQKILWHATSEQEQGEIRKLFPQAKSITLPNLPKKINSIQKSTKQKDKLNLLFSSRISEKKNLLFALKVLQRIKSVSVYFHIYGIIEDEPYWQKCLSLIQKLPPNIQVEYKGTFRPDQTALICSKEDVLFLPTLNENYGHAIVECLLCGCPAIISDQTPWKDLEQHGAGYALPLSDKTAFVNAVQKMAEMTSEEFSSASKKAIDYISSKINVEGTILLYKLMFNDPFKN